MQAIINKIIKHIQHHDKIALFHHVMVDGDSLASSYGLAQAIKAKYPHKKVVVVGAYHLLQSRFWYLPLNRNFFTLSIDHSYLAIVGDCAIAARIEHFSEYQKAQVKIVYDHHQNGIDFDHDIFWHEPKFIASSMQACLIAEALALPWTEDIALNLVHGIITDSGRFSFSGAASLPHEITARMYRHIDDQTMHNLFANMNRKTLSDIKYTAWIYQQLQIQDQVGYVVVTKADQKQFAKTPNEATRVNLIANIEDEQAWIMFVEYPDFIRVELRSKGVPVNQVAMQFQGGGHIKAAGCQLDNFSQVAKVVHATIKIVRDFLN